MKIPVMKAASREKTTLSSFGGYDKRDIADSVSFADMKNMTGISFPRISTRSKRGVLYRGSERIFDIKTVDMYLNGAMRKNVLLADCENRIKAFYEDGGELVVIDVFNTTSTLSKTQKNWVATGSEMYFFPDNKRIDLLLSGISPLEYTGKYELGPYDDRYFEFIIEPCDLVGNDSDESSPYRRFRYVCYYQTEDGGKGEFSDYKPFNASVKEGDTFRLMGMKDASLNGYYNIINIPIDRSSLVVESTAVHTQSEGCVSLERNLPKMDFVISCQNRLWGCRYGTNSEGVFVNEIYASALGDATNWHRFLGISTDSYMASVGSSGAFTGAVCIDGVPVFFKEDAIIKVYGSYPSEFTVVESANRGIEAGSHRSAVFVNDELYYKTYSGIVRYDGGVPVNVDAPLGTKRYKNAVAGTVDTRYFVSMENESSERELFVYDTVKDKWHKEDDANISAFCRCGGDLYFLCDGEEVDRESVILSTDSGMCREAESDFEWMCESARFGYTTPEHKYVSSLQIRLEREAFSEVTVYIEYDESGVWRRQGTVSSKEKNAFIRVRPERCDCFRVRLCGKGPCEILSISKTFEKCSPYDKA